MFQISLLTSIISAFSFLSFSAHLNFNVTPNFKGFFYIFLSNVPIVYVSHSYRDLLQINVLRILGLIFKSMLNFKHPLCRKTHFACSNLVFTSFLLLPSCFIRLFKYMNSCTYFLYFFPSYFYVYWVSFPLPITITFVVINLFCYLENTIV